MRTVTTADKQIISSHKFVSISIHRNTHTHSETQRHSRTRQYRKKHSPVSHIHHRWPSISYTLCDSALMMMMACVCVQFAKSPFKTHRPLDGYRAQFLLRSSFALPAPHLPLSSFGHHHRRRLRLATTVLRKSICILKRKLWMFPHETW